jgi:HD superfamily phosphohydrolase
MEVRDPIHGAISVTRSELTIIDNPYLQRLRNIRQLGFSHLPFPGATHTRYAHCLGVMHLAGQAFDRAYRHWQFDSPDARERFRACVRLAALTHDLGHAPFSHCTEFAMPALSTLGIEWYRSAAPADQRATHEDYTIAIIERTSLCEAINVAFPCLARHVAALISRDVRVSDGFFNDGGLSHRRALSQIISSELDADRLDYLVRDAYYSGAKYGQVDVNWLVNSLSTHTADGQVWLALDSAALYALDDFLIARHHMFLMVYFHHKSVVYEEMLKRWVEAQGDWSIPADLGTYLFMDDIALEHLLRQDSNVWARRVVERRPYRRLVERHGSVGMVDLSEEVDRLQSAGIDVIDAVSTGQLSRYAHRRVKRTPVYVRERLPGQRAANVRPITDASQIFRRYADARSIGRIYVAPDDLERARACLGIQLDNSRVV